MKSISSFSPVLKSVCGSSGFGSGRGYGSCSCSCSKIVAKRNKNSHRPSPQGSEPAPPRITTNVKHSLQVLKLWKKRKDGTPKPATRYRRKKVEKEKEDLTEDDSELYLDPTLALYNTDEGLETGLPVMLVDGYNVCGYWAKLKKHFMKGRLEIARDKLIHELVTFSAFREMKVVVVFDATMSGLPPSKETFLGVDIVFPGKICADAWIEKEVTALKEDGCPNVWVVTSDHNHQQAANGSGAFVWSCKALVSEINDMAKEVEEMIEDQRSYSMQGKLLKHNLDPKIVDALKDLKKQLLQNQSK